MKAVKTIGIAWLITAVVAVLLAIPRLTSSPHVSVGAVVAFATVAGRPAVLAGYGRTGGANPGPWLGDVWQERLAAVALDTGELLWDVQLHAKEGWDRAVLAVADGLAYVATDEGLSVVAVDDGRIVAKNDRITGLGDYAHAHAAYHVDPRIDAVVALTTTGDVVQIPLGATEAAPSPTPIADAWRSTLSTDAAPMRDATFAMIDVDPAAIPAGMSLPDGGTVRLSRLTGDLIREQPDGERRLLTRVDLDQPHLLYDIVRTPAALATPEQMREGVGIFTRHHSAAAPLGSVNGVVLVHGNDPNTAARASLRLIDVGTGEAVAVVADLDTVTRATATPTGDILVLARPDRSAGDNRLIVLRPDGCVLATDIGLTDFWGRPRAEPRGTDAC